MKDYIFGNIQDCKIGQIFINRKDLHIAGIHGPLQAGIWGKASEGACSIVLSGGYIDDRDALDKITYTGDSGRDPKNGRQSSDQVLSPGNSGLIKSFHDKLPIRVSRGFQTNLGPEFGYRFDGLYFISDYVYKKGSDGFMVYQFYLSSENTKEELQTLIKKNSIGSTIGLLKTNKPMNSRSQNIPSLDDRFPIKDNKTKKLDPIKQEIEEPSNKDEDKQTQQILNNTAENVSKSNDNNSISIQRLNLSVRSLNGLLNANIYTLEDLSQLSKFKLNRIPNLGKKSINEIWSAFETFDQDIQLPKESKSENQKFELYGGSIAILMDTLFEEKYEKHKEWILQRLFHGLTLEECGKIMGVTRERIRQVEAKFIKTIKSRLSYDETNIISIYLQNNPPIKNMYYLELADPLFRDISRYLLPATKANVFFSHFLTKTNLARWEYVDYQYKIFNNDALSSEEIILSYNLNSEAHFKLSLKDSVKAECLIARREDVYDYVYKAIYKKFINSGESIIGRYGLARLRFKLPGVPIHVDSIKDLIKNEFNFNMRGDDRVIAAAFVGRDETSERTFVDGLYSYGNLSFIFIKDVIDEAAATIIVKHTIKILDKNPGRQTNLRNLLNKILAIDSVNNLIEERSLNMTVNLLTVIMRKYAHQIDSRIRDHGRLIWSISEKDAQISSKRIEKYPLILQILEENGAPMLVRDISKEVSKVRGSSQFQIHTTLSTPKVTLIQRGLWGLRDRDINVTKTQEEQLVAAILQSFDKGKKIIDIYDILKFKESSNIDPSVKCFQIAKMLLAHIPVGRRRTIDKVIFLQKCSMMDLNRFAIYSIDITDEEIDEYILNLSLEDLPIGEIEEGKHGLNFWSLEKACQFFIKTNIKNGSQYIKWRRYDAKDEKSYLPQRPEVKYREKWLGWDRLEEML